MRRSFVRQEMLAENQVCNGRTYFLYQSCTMYFPEVFLIVSHGRLIHDKIQYFYMLSTYIHRYIQSSPIIYFSFYSIP